MPPRTFADIRPASSDSDDEKKAPDLYAGGHASGMAIQGNPQGNKDALIDQIVRQARQGAIQSQSSSDMNDKETTKTQKTSVFKGKGRAIAQEDVKENIDEEISIEDTKRGNKKSQHMLTFWRNGFTIDDGDLRSESNPEDKAILESILAGRAPTHIFKASFDEQVEIAVAERRSELYEAPKPVPQKFGGTGNRLGSEHSPATPASSSSASQNVAPAKAAASNTQAVGMSLDPTKPATSVQIRMADGTRMVVKMNLSHQVADIRKWIIASRIGEGARSFSLMTTFPPKIIEDESITIEDAKLAGAVLQQKYT